MTRQPRWSKRRGTVALTGLLGALLLFPAAGRAARIREAPPAPVHPLVLERTESGASAEFLVVLRDRAELGGVHAAASRRLRGRTVREALWETAEHSQRPLRRWLDERGVRYRPFYIVNALLVHGGRGLVEALARRREVARIEANPVVHNDLPAATAIDNGRQAAGIEWGVERVNAPDLWAMGFTGQGIVVGGQDTGYDWTHLAIRPAYRGWNGSSVDHDFNWHDSIHDSVNNPCGNDSPVPCDDQGHGTHTMGTVVGDDGAGNRIGVAPGARWIGCRNMDQGNGTPARYLECMEFFLAPYPVGGTPGEGDPSLAPDVTTNSWTCPPSEGCSWDTLRAGIEALRAAGIMVVVAAGNEGPACGTVAEPPAIYQAAFAVGATDSFDDLAAFSSRGPAATNLDFPEMLRPNLVAPGVAVRSCIPGGRYATLGGTSMATPHVAGTVALLWSALPGLRNDIATTEALLTASARPLPAVVESCGGDYVTGPNNSWGTGLVDAAEAYARGVAAGSPPAPRRATGRAVPAQ